jgi:glycosyltransferase involved in cell wall biosynthesis
MPASRTHAHLICHINMAGGYRGGERQTELLIRELASRGRRQRLVARAGGPLGPRCRDIDGLTVVEVFPNQIRGAVAARGASLVHAHEGRAMYSAWFLSLWQKTPFVVTRRIDHAMNDTWLRTRAYHGASSVVAISTSIANTVHAHYPAIRCEIIPSAHADMVNGHAVAGSLRRRLEGKTIVGHIGELDHGHKGQGTIIAAARHFRALRPELHFVLVGNGKDEGRFRQAAAELDNLEFVGFVENVEDYLAAFDVFVYPSLREGLGSSILDAMHFGLPIVASDVGGIPEIVEDQVNGLLVRPDNGGDLVAALERVVSNADLRAAMSRRNREKAARYGAARMASSYEQIYDRILESRALRIPAPL